MNDISSRTSDATSLFHGTLIVGNHDSITLFGSQPQRSLNDYSRRITNLLFKETKIIDTEIANILSKIEQFEKKATRSCAPSLVKHFRHNATQKEYQKVTSYIENMTLFFKLQQVQLLKEIKILEKLADAILLCTDDLNRCIETGKSFLLNRSPCHKRSERSPLSVPDDHELAMWYSRLETRIQDLYVSHTISIQIRAQIKLLYNNDLRLLDSIANTISNTFPIWQNQVAIMLGVELFESRVSAQKRVEKYTSDKNFLSRAIGVRQVQPLMNAEKILELNQILTTALKEMVKLEKTNSALREGFVNTSESKGIYIETR